MLRSNLKIAYRNLIKYKAYALPNIFGLAVGIAATILILLYIQFEFSYDDFHENKLSIYRVSVVYKKEGNIQYDSPVFTSPIGPAMKQDFPEVENFVRLSTPRVAYLSYNGHALKVSGICHADSTFFHIFSFELLSGSPQHALVAPYSMVLTEKTAKRLFGSESPLGKTLRLDNRDSYQITGVIAGPPANSPIQFNALVSFSTLYYDPNLFMDWNGGNQYISYVKLAEHACPSELEKKFPDFMWGYINKEYVNYGLSLEPYLQALKEIHLHHNDYSDAVRTNIYVFAAVALLILSIACINFVNLTTARAAKRAKEVGVRKVLGANKYTLMKQFLGESTLLSLITFCMAIVLVELFMPLYQELLSEQLPAPDFADLTNIGGLLLIVFFVGITAGIYPAFHLSSFQAMKTLKGEFATCAGKRQSRNTLVVLQFAISISLIIGTILVNRQLGFMKSKELGFNKENILLLPLIGDEVKVRYGTLKRELSRISGVAKVAASSEIPHDGLTSNGYLPEGFRKPIMIHVVDVDEDFLETFNIDLISGRSFSDEISTDQSAYVVNESLAKSLDWEDPTGKIISRNGDHQVIGMVKDFHFATLHSQIQPLIITNQPWRGRFNYLSVKILSGNVSETLGQVQSAWKAVSPSTPFDYWFLNDAFDQLYKSEQRFREIFLYFSVLAIIIALLGLMSLVSFSIEQRTKEIGIRKVLGASVLSITGLISRNFLKLILLANLIAWPIAYFAMNKWLENFAYRIDIGWWVFALAGGLALMIALLTVSTQAIRAALANPIDSLRYE